MSGLTLWRLRPDSSTRERPLVMVRRLLPR